MPAPANSFTFRRPGCQIALVAVMALAARSAPAAIQTPEAVDQRLVVELFAAEPDIVTPIGIDVDESGRVFVIESNTHFPKSDYKGPPTDRIRVFQDTDGDGKADHITTFFEGEHQTMALALYRDGSLYVATRRQVFRLRDTNGDGKADQRTSIARLDTPGDYPHNGLSGFAIDFDGSIVFGFGENLGAPYRLIGSDGTTLSGGGEGGNIYRCDPDGRNLTRIATGFWNPFNVCFDAFGRLFAVDNDPDSRPPCRLLHIVPGGDYGFRFRNGRKGLHPFTAWNGELPGTLPMVAGTGEAPSGVVAYESDNLPADYVGTLLSTSWGDHRIERFKLNPQGASFTAAAEPIIRGGENFRPVGIAIGPDGSLFVTDWVDRSYNVHGKGRIWHIRAKAAEPAKRVDWHKDPRGALGSTHRPIREAAARELAGQGNLGRQILRQRAQKMTDDRLRVAAIAALTAVGDPDPGYMAAALKDGSVDVRQAAVRLLPQAAGDWLALARDDPAPPVRAAALRRMVLSKENAADALKVVLSRLADDDPFVRQAAVDVLIRSPEQLATLAPAYLKEPRQQLGVLLAKRSVGGENAQKIIPWFLQQSDVQLRFAAAQWVGEQGLEEYRDLLAAGLSGPAMTPELFAGYLAALSLLDGAKPQEADKVGLDFYLARSLHDANATPAVQAMALRLIQPDHKLLTAAKLAQLLHSQYEPLRLEAVRTLRDSALPQRGDLLSQIATDESEPAELRAEAVMGLQPQDSAQRSLVLNLAVKATGPVQAEALRSLRGCELTGPERTALAAIGQSNVDTAALVARALDPNAIGDRPKPADTDAWVKLLAGKADVKVGRRIFFQPRAAGCYRCHRANGRGGDVGPDLSLVGRSFDRKRLLESILQPSKEIAPRWFAWLIETTDGHKITAGLVGESATGEQTYADSTGQLITLKPAEIVSRRPQPLSIMPDNLHAALTVQELRDLVAFLETLK